MPGSGDEKLRKVLLASLVTMIVVAAIAVGVPSIRHRLFSPSRATRPQDHGISVSSAHDGLYTLLATLRRHFNTLSQASTFHVTVDPTDSRWAEYNIFDPSVGSGYGFAHLQRGKWELVGGPGSAGVGCGGPYRVPRQVLSSLKATCPPTAAPSETSGASGTSGSGTSGSGTSGSGTSGPAPPSQGEIAYAYQQGARWGQLAANSVFPPQSQFMAEGYCRTYGNTITLANAFFEGCMAAVGY